MSWIGRNQMEIKSLNVLKLILLAAWCFYLSNNLQAQLATGGGFSLERSLTGATQQIASSGAQFSLTGSFGEGFTPANNDRRSLCGPMKRVYDGFLWPLQMDPSTAATMLLNNGNIQI